MARSKKSAGKQQSEETAVRHFAVYIRKVDANRFQFIPHGKFTENAAHPVCFERFIDEQQLRSQIQTLLSEWTEMVDYRVRVRQAESETYSQPFQDSWDLRNSPEYLQKFAPRLALAGLRLFRLLFVNNHPDEKLDDQHLRSSFVSHLITSLSSKRNTITFCSDDLFVPWQMLYTTGQLPIPSKLSPEKVSMDQFWGFNHNIEHCPKKMPQSAKINIRAGTSTVPAGLHFDEGLQLDVPIDLIARQRKYFKSHAYIRGTERLYRRELVEALEGNLKDQIMYFFCHGMSPADADKTSIEACSLQLSADPHDQKRRISAADLETLIDDDGLSGRPLVFCNTCKGGQMTSFFYESIPKVLLRKGAVALVGPLIDIPGLFADELSRRFFRAFVADRNKKPKTLSSVLRDLTRGFVTQHNNPLGLAYSVYRGVDVALRWNRK